MPLGILILNSKSGGNNMLMNIILWILFGALAGWIASIIMRTNQEQGALANIIVGIAGAFLGGFVMRAITGNDVTGFNLGSLIVAIIGAVILLAIYKAFRRPHHI
jgi:uncharacterized membrane protein YeaQ/YmgE (transglycosylase-associated protein family)